MPTAHAQQSGPHFLKRPAFSPLLRLHVWFCSLLLSSGLAVLGAMGEPLPLLSFAESCALTAAFGLICLAVILLLGRLHPLSFPALFLVGTFLFTCSSLILYPIFGNEAFSRWHFIDLATTQQALVLVMLAFSAFLAGSFFPPRRSNPEAAQSPGPAKPDGGQAQRESALKWVGILTYLAAIAIILFYTAQGSALKYSFEGGYHAFAAAKRDGEMPTLVVASLSYLLPWSLLIWAAASRSKKGLLTAALCALPALAILFLAGNRSAPLTIMVLIAACVYLKRFPGWHLGWRHAVVLFGLVMLLIPAVRNLRNIPVDEWSTKTLTQSLSSELDPQQRDEEAWSAGLHATSASLQTLVGTLKLVPEKESYRWGTDYLRPLLVAIPFRNSLAELFGSDNSRQNQHSWIDAIEDDRYVQPTEWISYHLNPQGLAGLAYLQLAEAYLQFGVVGVMGLYFLLGLHLTRLWRALNRRGADARQLALSLIWMMALLTWIRHDASAIVRFLAWGWLLVYLAPALIQSVAAGALLNLSSRSKPPVRA